MIYTVFTRPSDPSRQWHADLLESSWQRAQQPGELVRLTPTAAGGSAPAHDKATVVPTLAWNPHPYTGDQYEGYDMPASLLEWLFRTGVEGTVLILDSRSILTKAITDEVEPGTAVATPWPEFPSGEGPFGLAMSYKFVECYCVNRTLALAPVQPPLLMHSSDLRKIAPRWAELTALIRADGQDTHGKPADADRLAYCIAAAEYRVRHDARALGTDTSDESTDAPVIGYRRPVESPRGEIVWDDHTYEPWSEVYPEKAAPGAGRVLLSHLNEMATRIQSGADLAAKRPLRKGGVREARVLDETQLEVPGYRDFVTLNASAAAIWDLCDGERNLAGIVEELERRFDAPTETLRDAVRSTARELVAAGAIELEESV